MRTKFIIAVVAAVAFSQVSASEPAIQASCATCSKGAGLPQKTIYAQNVYPQTTHLNYAAARKAAIEAAMAASYDSDIGSSSVSGGRTDSLRQASYDSNPAAGSVSGGRVNSPIVASYGRYKDSDAAAPVYAARNSVGPNSVGPNGGVVSAQPNEELLGPFSGIASAIESSVESSVLGKVTSLPASRASKFESSIQSRESSILGIASLNGTHASTTGSSNPADESRSADESDKREATEETKKEGSGEEKKSGADVLLWESGSVFAVALFALGVLFA